MDSPERGKERKEQAPILGENDGLGLSGLARMLFAIVSRAFQEGEDSKASDIQETIGCLDFIKDILSGTDLGDSVLFNLSGHDSGSVLGAVVFPHFDGRDRGKEQGILKPVRVANRNL